MHFSKQDFPFFKNNNKTIYFDNSGTSIRPKQVIDEISNYYNYYSTNAHNMDSKIGFDLVTKIEAIREEVKKFINAKKADEIIFVPSTTYGINQIAYGLKEYIKANDEVVVTEFEHASNFLPWVNLTNETKSKLKFFDIKDFLIDITKIKNVITKKTKIVSFAVNSNTFGYFNDPKKIIAEIRKINKDVIIIIDAAQTIMHEKVDVSDFDADFLVFSAHKIFGPTGIGILYGKYHLLEKLKPMLFGGGMSTSYVKKTHQINYSDIPLRFEGGSANAAGILGLGKAIEYINHNLGGISKIHKYVIELRNYAIKKMKEILKDRVIIYNDMYNASILLFNIKNVFSQDVASYLGIKENIILRAGQHCNKMFADLVKEKTSLRVSFSVYNSKAEIDKLVDILAKEKEFLLI